MLSERHAGLARANFAPHLGARARDVDSCPLDSGLELCDDLVLLDEVAPLDQHLLDHTGHRAPDLDHLVGLDDTVQGLR